MPTTGLRPVPPSPAPQRLRTLGLGSLVVWACMALPPGLARANTAIETETAELGKQGDIGNSNSLEIERAPDGWAIGTVQQLEYAITDRSEILIEPFFQDWEFPNDEKSFHGIGDLELTPSYMFVVESTWVPALVAAFKLKVPMAQNRDIGSGKFDYYPYLIVGKKLGPYVTNFNVGVNFVTPPDGEGGSMEKDLIWDAEIQRDLADFTVFAEVYSSEDQDPTVSGAVEYHFTKIVSAFVAGSYSRDKVAIVRPGFNLEF